MDNRSDSEVDWENEVDEVWEEQLEFNCLFCKNVLMSLNDLWNHCKEAHNFDFQKVKNDHHLEFYDCIKLINYIRSQVAKEKPIDFNNLSTVLASDEYMISVFPDDAVLFSLGDTLDSDFEEDALDVAVDHKHTDSNKDELKSLRLQTKMLSTQLEEIRKEKMEELTSQTASSSLQEPGKLIDNDSYYFESYAGNDIHFVMLSDSVRTEGYRDFIYENKNLFHGKTVLDVGCGTGILSMFCAKAGAKQVYAVDNSDIIQMARTNAYENNLADKITFIRGKIEEIQVPVPKVDIIVSEWMGYALTFESMIDSVLIARDRFLAADGLMAPSETRLVLSATTNSEILEEPLDFWSDVYGFKMNCMKDASYNRVNVDVIPASYVNAEPVEFATINMHTCQVQDVSFKHPFSLTMKSSGPFCSFLVWFDTYFTTSKHQPVPSSVDQSFGFTTGPHGTPTHWKQCTLILRERPHVEAGSVIHGSIAFIKNSVNNRDLDIEVSYHVNGQDYTQSFILN
ncbi:type I ribosomal protein arginine N- methyltransferase Rmt3 [Schizosaccharomyces cryophilus OY26]|uniref:type I protein arginine methyltransferase n=1 Tax=Schizosaccharomyces cryophilus (strain OY26 / ATCC MYA-4695 / CBS 11777 / NBRC 106824 / NRRL Y48691) TaxID=653667 RepID=S9VT13_SCHCR|nr:type I ribosomal protein arginine N- methyltransferase Rmt3 [Schizosaccharomyces cryophilus OY26]EPY49270.1 type I ribosomal protein arginine N- methyltransferase Rmt3 [Schizosaccharomyces cryophilus OY26]